MSTWDDNLAEIRASFDKVDVAIKSCTEALEDSEESLDEIEEQLEMLEQGPTLVIESFASMCHFITTGTDELVESVESIAEERIEQITDLGGKVGDDLEEHRDAIREALSTIVESFTETLTSGWLEASTSGLMDSDDLIKSCIDDKLGEVTNLGSHVEEMIQDSIDELREYIESRLAAVVQEQGQETLDTAVERLAGEVVDAIVTSQLQVQTTAYLAPYIPHLAVAKALAPVIRDGLKIMRAGF